MINLNDKTIGQQIKVYREKLKLSQEALAQSLSIPRPSVSLIEAGKRSVTAVELATLANLFNIDITNLIQPSVTITPSNTGPETEIIFLRHGEAMDDVFNQYGGWADPDLSAAGINKAYTVAQTLKKLGIRPEIIYSSPLKRAKTKAEILAREMEVESKVLLYLKERNTYGLLCGINKETAQKKYPDLVASYEKGDYVLASERLKDFISRIKHIFEFISQSGHRKIICVTHQKLITAIIVNYLDMNPQKLDDGCILITKMDKKGLYYVSSEGITFTRNTK